MPQPNQGGTALDIQAPLYDMCRGAFYLQKTFLGTERFILGGFFL